MLKKILIVVALVVALFLVIAFTIPLLFKGKILAIAKEQANKNLNAKVDFSDADISLLRHFPRLAVGLDNLYITGTESFQNDTLISAKQIDITLNLFSLFGGSEINIYRITADQPRIHAIVNKDGQSNWDIGKTDSSSSSEGGKGFRMHLQSYQIKNAYIHYTDIPSDMACEIKNLDHSGNGDFSADLFTLHTKTSAGSVSFTRAKIPYLAEAKVSLSADFEVDNRTKKFQFKTDDVHLNDLQLATDGFFQFVNDSTYGMDIRFRSPSTEFKTILSLIPSLYKTDFDRIKTSGTATFSGFVKGEYNAEKIPSYSVSLKIDNGFFQYPDLPQPVKNIGIDLKVENPDGITDHTVLNIARGHIEFGNDPFDFTILFRKPLTDQYLEANVRGKINLADITRFVKLKSGTELSGLLDANASAAGNLSAVTKQNSGPFTANGYIQITGLNYRSPDFPQPLLNSSMQITFQNPDGNADHTLIQIPEAHIEVGTDPVDFNISLKTPVSNPVFNGRLKGRFNLANTRQFTQLPAGTNISGTLYGDILFSGSKQAVDKSEYEKINTAGTLDLKDIQYKSKDYPDGFLIHDASFSFNPKNIILEQGHAEYLKSQFTASGSLENVLAYVLKNESLTGSLDIYADQINLNKFMQTIPADSSKSKTAFVPFQVPSNLGILIHAKVGKLHYDKVEYENLSGSVAVGDEIIALKDVHMEALDGIMTASGFYSTKKDKKTPDISFTYDVQGLDIQKTFYAFNTVQKIMPAGQYVDGKMNSRLSLNGKLDAQMMPDLKTLTGNGTLDLINGVFKKFAPVEKLAQTIHLSQLNGLSLKDVRLSFEFANGKVLVQPFHVKYQGIDMEIGGMHGFDQSIDYAIAMKIPRALLGIEANNLVNNLTHQAVAKGVPVKVSDQINMKVNLTGTMTNPQIKTGLNSPGADLTAEVKQQTAVFAKQATDSIKTVVNAKTGEAKDSVIAIKNQAVRDLQHELGKSLSGQNDSSGTGGKPLETTRKNAEQTLKNTFDNLFNRKKTPADSTKNK